MGEEGGRKGEVLDSNVVDDHSYDADGGRQRCRE